MTKPTVFNLNSVNSGGTLFLSENRGLSIQRFDKPKYPQLLKLLNAGIGLFWVPEEISMKVDAAKFRTLNEADKHVVLSNIKRQILLDSIMGRSPIMMFGPLTSDPILEGLSLLWSYQEFMHSKSYTHIAQNAFPDPESVLGGVLDIDDIVKCSETISSVYDNCIDLCDAYYKGECSRIDAIRSIYLAIHAANALESIRFPVSFACSFLYAHLGLLPGVGVSIGFINRDESFHVAITNALLKILPVDDPDFKAVSEDPEVLDMVRKIWADTIIEESDWINYLFSQGEVLGLNAVTLRQYLCYVTTKRLEKIDIGTIEDIVPGSEILKTTHNNPINWINDWISNKTNQPSPQEVELNNYERNIIDVDSLSFANILKELSI